MLTAVYLVLIGQMFNLIVCLSNAHSRRNVSNEQHRRLRTSQESQHTSSIYSKYNFTNDNKDSLVHYLDKSKLRRKRGGPRSQRCPFVHESNRRLQQKAFRAYQDRINGEEQSRAERGKLSNASQRVNTYKKWRSMLRRDRRAQPLTPMAINQNNHPSDHLKFTPKITPSPAKIVPQEHKPNYQQLSSIISQMTPEAQSTLVDILVKNLAEKSQVTPEANKNQYLGIATTMRAPLHDLMATAVSHQALQLNRQQLAQLGISSMKERPDDRGILPTNVNVDKDKLQSLFSLLNSESIKNSKHLQNSYESNIVREEVRKPGRCHKCRPRPQACHGRPASPKASQAELDVYSPHVVQVTNSDDSALAEENGKLVNLTQVFNVHPKLLVVNSRLPNSRIHSKCRKPLPRNKPCRKLIKDDSDKGYDTFNHLVYDAMYDDEMRSNEQFKNEISPT